MDSPVLEKRKAIAREILNACRTCGFFYIKNHGIQEDTISRTFASLRRFFALDFETKMEAHVQKNPAIRGYEPMLETRLDPTTRGGEHCYCSEYQDMTLTKLQISRRLSPWVTA